MRINHLLNLLVILFLSTSMSAQIMLKEVFLGEQIEKSSLVIEGKVLSKNSYWDANHEKIYTVNTIGVYKVFKGEPISEIEIITPGGVVELDAQIVYPSLKLRDGDIGVFTLYEDNTTSLAKNSDATKRFKPFGSLQGFYRYNLDNGSATNTLNAKSGIGNPLYQEIKSYTGTDYIEMSPFDVQSKTTSTLNSSLAVGITSFSPLELTAGTKSVLTINGTEFGTTKGNVSFYNADNAGASFINALDSQVLTWTNSQITVEVPSEAGTGKIKVIHSDGTAITSNNALMISKAQSNIITDYLSPGVNKAYETQLVDDNGKGGYTWQMTTGFSQLAGAKEAFSNALRTWSCETQMNWDLNESNLVSASNAQHKAVSDGINTITFDNSASADPEEDLPDTVLGLRTSYYSACNVVKNGLTTLEWYIKEFDIVFDDETNWNFNPTNPDQTEIDFESVALHELGHCRQLDHIIDTDNVMHYAITKGETLRGLSSENIAIANLIQDKSTSVPVCSASLMTDYAGSCSLGIEEDELKEGLKVYPNPTRGQVFLNTGSDITLEKVSLFDINGRQISQFVLSGSSRQNTIDLSNFARGVYFMNIYSDTTFITKKIILE